MLDSLALHNITTITHIDIDECSENTHNCSKNARCINRLGDYDCLCEVGYEGDGMTCARKSINIKQTRLLSANFIESEVSRNIVISVISLSSILIFVIFINILLAGCIRIYKKLNPSMITKRIRTKM